MKRLFHSPSIQIKQLLLGLGIIIMSALITFVLIKVLYEPSVTKVTSGPTATIKTISSTDLIKKYTTGYKIDNYTVDSSIGNPIITYKLSDTAYTIQVNSLDTVQFTRPDNSTSSDIVRAIDNSKTYLTSNGFNKVSEQILTNSTQSLYDNQNTVCKVFSSLDTAKKASTYGLVCADKKVFIAERDAIQILLTIYKQKGGTIDFKNIVRTTHTEGNKSLSLLAINPQDSSKAPYMLIFASIDNKWSYIGSRIAPSVDIQDSFTLSPQLKAVVNDPKYGGFLAKYIQ